MNHSSDLGFARDVASLLPKEERRLFLHSIFRCTDALEDLAQRSDQLLTEAIAKPPMPPSNQPEWH